MVPNKDIAVITKGGNNSRVVDLTKMILRYGQFANAVCNHEGKVIISTVYAKAVKLLGMDLLVYVLPEGKEEMALSYFSKEYGVFEYSHLERKTYIQSFAQKARLREKNGVPSSRSHSTLYERLVLPFITKDMHVLDCEKSRQKPKPEDAGDDYKPEYETYTELETLNSMVPIWKRPKNEVKDEDYNEFYKNKFMDYTDPLRVITSRTEGTATYTALLFIHGSTAYDYYTKEYEKGLALYASGVMIMEKCADLLPDYFSFVKGVVDSEDLSLNISRETLQKDNQLKLMRNSLEKKIKNELHAMLVNDREKYETFWKNFGRQIKFGIYGDYGMHKDLLGDLLMFYSAKEKKLVTLDEYVEKMPEEQKCIYFAAGDDTDRLGKLPNAQLVLSKGYDLLLCTEDVDEFCLQMMRDYKEKEFKNINSGDLGLETEDEKKAAEAAETENKDLFEEIKKDLNGKVKEVKVNPTLQEHPVTLSAEGGISMEMEKVLRRMPNAEGVESTKVLELNPNHTVFAALKAAHAAGDTDKVAKYAELLYDQALLIAGLPIEDPVAYAQLVCGLMQ